jgi:outer membrane cobalamin receptor
LLNTEKQSDIFGGINIDLTQGFRVNAGLSMASLQRMPFFTNSITDSTRFEVLYDGDAVDRTNVYGEVVYEKVGALRSALRFDFFDYKLNTLADPYHKPKYQAVLNNSFFPIENLKVSADLYYLGGLVGLNRESNTRVELDDIIDLNLGGDYNLNERISVFLQFKNILGKEYERYLNYRTRGIQFLGGITVSF